MLLDVKSCLKMRPSVPRPFYGAGYNLLPNENYFRSSLSYGEKSKERISLDDMKNEQYSKYGYEIVPEEDADISYILRRSSFAIRVDYFRTVFLMESGGGIGLDPYPYLQGFIGFNHPVVEAGAYLRFGVAKNFANYEGNYGELDVLTIVGSDTTLSQGSYSEQNLRLYNPNLALGFFADLFPTDWLSINISQSLIQPWLFRSSLPISFGESYYDYDITVDFPMFFSEYAGLTFTLFDHVQLSVGASVFNSLKWDGFRWFMDTSLAYLF